MTFYVQKHFNQVFVIICTFPIMSMPLQAAQMFIWLICNIYAVGDCVTILAVYKTTYENAWTITALNV